jgi:N-acetylglucosaminyldiphosphoundecaprenol N-acetyl-beta-D-mannosaminyltransferase
MHVPKTWDPNDNESYGCLEQLAAQTMTESTTGRSIWRTAMTSARSPRVWTALGLSLLALAFVLTVRYVPLSEIMSAIRSADIAGILIALVCLVAGQLLRIWRSKRILQARAPQASLRIAQGLLGSQIVNWLSPVRIGEVWRVWHVSGKQVSNVMWTATSIVIEKSADAFVLAIFAFAATMLPVPPVYATPIARLLLTAFGGAMLVSALSALTSHRVRDRLLARLPRIDMLMQRARLEEAPSGREYATIWLEAFLYSFGIWSLAIGTNVALARAFGLGVPLEGHLILLLALQTSMVFSPIPGNIGLFSIVAATVLAPLAIAEAHSIAFGLVLWAIVYGALLTMGLVALLSHSAASGTAASDVTEIKLLGTRVHRLRLKELLERAEAALTTRSPLTIAYANAHALNLSHADPELQAFFNTDADIVFCDGFGVKWAARIAGAPEPPERYTPPDWIDALCARCASAGHTIGLLGDAPDVAARAARVLEQRHAGLRIVLTQHGYFDKRAGSADNNAVLQQIADARPDVLLVGMGMPVQEIWLRANRHRINAPLVITVGALFRFISGDHRRAPRWMTDHGLEWLGRLVIEPGRLWRRYLIESPLVMIRALRQRISTLISS